MNYEKLTVERFEVRLKEGAYQGLTGARRAIGKTDWSKKDKDRAHELANKYFGSAGEKPAPKKAAGKKPSAPKKAAAAKPSAKKTAAAKPAPAPKVKAATPKREPAVREARAEPTPASTIPPGPPVLEEVTRQNSASAVISAMRNSGPLNPLEQRAYDIATAEYAENASRAARRVVDTARRGVPVPKPLQADAEAPAPVVTAPPGAPRVPVQNGVEPELTPEEKAQLERLERGAAAVPAILGQGSTS